jgi:hypothetical protein
MKRLTIIKLLFIGLTVFTVVGCLEGDESNTPPGGQTPFLIMTNNASGAANNPISGLNYFGSQSLTFPSSHTKDSIVFFVALEGTGSASKDINITLTSPADALDDYFFKDSIEYLMMPDSIYDIVSTSGTIVKGESYAEFMVYFYPSKFDPTQNFMLPIIPSNDADYKLSSNYGALYYHSIGNAIAATYNWTYRRYNNADTVGATSGTASGPVLFSPVNPTTAEAYGGYASTVGLTAPYSITFTNNGGVLSNFKVSIDASLAGGLTANGITITQPPAFLKAVVTPTSRHFKIWYQVHNGTAFRTLIDEFKWNQ